ncbi:MAG: hypothetical protein IKT46_09530 [Clostridia bacterium]|nr:hypothetical protein [Clostridia bacterium]
MKRVLFFLVLIPILCSCTQSRHMPCIEGYPLCLTGSLEYNGEVYGISLEMPSEDSALIAVTSPQRLAGYSFKVDKSSVWVYYDNIEIELCAPQFELPCLLITEMLRFSPADFEYSRNEGGSILYRYTRDMYPVTVYTDKGSSLPRRIEYSRDGCDIVLDIEALEFK